MLIVRRVWLIVVLITSVVSVGAAQPQDTLSWDIDLASDDEPGEPLIVAGTIYAPDGTPLAGKRVHVFQTDAEGLLCEGTGR